jgi:tetratricopeptide (TPR) repeat protein
MTGAVWQGAFVAGAFALHPLHVESVAWVAERKDLLSGFFWMLTIAAYLRYSKRLERRWYLGTLLIFALGLMTKPMLVTLPFVLLLLDYWPLGRFKNDLVVKDNNRRIFYRLIREKAPFFVLSVASSVIALVVQQTAGAVKDIHILPLNIRIANAAVSYVGYIWKMIWPSNLAVFYPHPGDKLAIWQGIIAGLALVGISILVVQLARSYKYLLVGWFWYLGTLVPVIGLVQVGDQAMADRYTYLSSIGIFVIASWGAAELSAKWRSRKIMLGISAGVVLAALFVCTRMQARYWHNSVTLFEHALQVTADNGTARNNLGYAIQSQGKINEAIIHYRRALQLEPDIAAAHNNLGLALQSQGKLDEAIEHYQCALQLNPDYAKAHHNLGYAFRSQGRLDEAISHYNRALELKPELAETHNNVGNLLQSQGKLDEAVSHDRQAVQLKPDFAEAHYNLANTLQSQGKLDEALSHYQQAMLAKPDWPLPIDSIAWILATHPDPRMRDPGQAIALAERAAGLTGYQNATILRTLAAAYAAAGQFDRAAAIAQKCLDSASASHDSKLADYFRKQLEFYKNLKP